MRINIPSAVLFLHAFPLNKKMYQYQFEAFERENIPYIAVDYFGFGEEKNFPSDYSISWLTDWIVAKLNNIGIKKIIPVGDSMGGYIMFDMWRKYRNLISGMVFVSTRAEADTEEAKKGRYATIEKIKTEGKDFLIEFMLNAQTSPKTKENKNKMEKLRCIMNEATEEGIIKALKALAERPDNTELLPTIEVPSLVIAGEDDEKVTPPSVVKKIADGIKNSRFIELPHSAHLPPFENPEEFNKIIIPFVKENL
ncbi:alpha/beta fold hydrolase [Persephonella sp.]